jgi:hypothetical protein
MTLSLNISLSLLSRQNDVNKQTYDVTVGKQTNEGTYDVIVCKHTN